MDNPSIPSLPSNEEKTHFFFGLPTQPVLSARTDCVTLPWTRPLYRILGPVTDIDLVRKWKDAGRSPNGDNNSCGSSVGNSEGNLDDALVNVLTKHKIEWTFYVPFVIHGRPYQDVGWHPVDYTCRPEATEQNTTYLFIGVQKCLRTCHDKGRNEERKRRVEIEKDVKRSKKGRWLLFILASLSQEACISSSSR